MEGSLGEYIFVAVIISILVNLIISRIGNLMRLRRDRERRANTPIPDMRPYHVPDNNTPSIPPQPQNNVAHARPVRRTANGVPPLPVRGEVVRRGPETFPSCPICRCRNRTAQDRLVIWNASNRNWRCYNGHVFNS